MPQAAAVTSAETPTMMGSSGANSAPVGPAVSPIAVTPVASSPSLPPTAASGSQSAATPSTSGDQPPMGTVTNLHPTASGTAIAAPVSANANTTTMCVFVMLS